MTLPIYLLVLLVFINRYIGGMVLRRLRGARFDEADLRYEPTVSIVIPMFNEGRGIYETINSLLEQDYPAGKLSITVVDDCSSDDSLEWARRAARGRGNVLVLKNPENMGKRRSINHAVRRTDAEIVVSVDSDVVVDRQAVRQLVARFVRPEIAAVGGRVGVRNAHENWLTRMQAVKYFLGYEYMKSLERSFRSVLCLSGCLTAYRRSVLLELEPVLERRAVLGVPIKYGEDRFLTRQIIKAGYETVLTLEARCHTTAPAALGKYFLQQLRWRRSNTIDFLCGLSHIWRQNPFVTMHYLSLFLLLLVYPLIIFECLQAGTFFELATTHLFLLLCGGLAYRAGTRAMPAEERVGPLSLLPMVFVMPLTYLICTPLAVFTLDSGSWETRVKAQAAT